MSLPPDGTAQAGRLLVRYRPYLLALGAVVLVAAFLPGPPRADDDVVATRGGLGTSDALRQPTADGTASTEPGQGGTAGAAEGGRVNVGAGAATGTSGPGDAAGATGGLPGATDGAAMGPDCDLATGRIMVPTIYAPPCRPPFSGDNGGRTYQGVTEDEITVAVYVPQSNAAAQAALSAAGVSDTREQTRASYEGFVDYFGHHYELYGRKIKLVFVEASGPADDDAAGKADAIRIAVEHKAFAALGYPNEAYVAELAARGVMCVCTVLAGVDQYTAYAPLRWGADLMTASQNYLHLAEYVGKRLVRRRAQWAGDPTLQASERKLGLIYLDPNDASFRRAADDFERELGTYGARLGARFGYDGDLGRAQEFARTVIAKFQQAGVTSVMCMCDPISPAFFTKEATNQRYFPEWVITGYFLTDSAVFGRTYDQQQWAHAFGVAQLETPFPRPDHDGPLLWRWHHGNRCPAPAGCQTVYNHMNTLLTGVHMAGPRLTPETIRDGLFAVPPAGGGPTRQYLAFGPAGSLWPFDDYSPFDDMVEVWWDRTATGPDEIDNPGVGLLRFVDGGRRIRVGQWPTTEPKAFDPAGTVFRYEEMPESDRAPAYEHRHHRSP